MIPSYLKKMKLNFVTVRKILLSMMKKCLEAFKWLVIIYLIK